MPTLKVTIRGCDNGEEIVVHGPGAGVIRMGQDQVQGLMEPPVQTSWKAQGRGAGGVLKGKRTQWRDLSLGFHVLGGHDHAHWYSRFRTLFDYAEDDWDPDTAPARIIVESDLSGTRWIDVLLHEAPDFNPGIDPLVIGHGNPIIPLRAGNPYWQEDPTVTTWTTTESSGNGVVTVANPTPVPMRHKWIGTRGTWVLPDVSWTGEKGLRVPGVDKRSGRDDSARAILMPAIGAVEGGFKVDLDTSRHLMVRDAHDTNLLGRMPVPGRFFEHVIPPYTPPTDLPVSVTDAPDGGAMVQCVQPRQWPWPYGGERL